MGDRVDELKGNVKEGIGRITGDEDLRAEGAAESDAAEARRELEGHAEGAGRPRPLAGVDAGDRRGQQGRVEERAADGEHRCAGVQARAGVPGADQRHPGDLADDSHWIAAACLKAEELKQDPDDGSLSLRAPASRMLTVARTFPQRNEYSVWVLPPGTQTRALRFSYDSPACNPAHGGWLGGVYLLADRFANIAPQAAALASVSAESAGRLNNSSWEQGRWDNGKDGGSHELTHYFTEPEHLAPVALAALAGVAAAAFVVWYRRKV